jgi:hypothetical protein
MILLFEDLEQEFGKQIIAGRGSVATGINRG